jgi:predicted acyltransferase (DUF342 family)
MAEIKARVGPQNVVRVLSNASAQPTNLINLFDVESTLKTVDGMILVWDLPTGKFIMTSVIDSSSTTIKGIAYFDNTTNSTLPTNGALIVSGGVGIGENLNVGGDIVIAGTATFSSDLDINAAVNILNGLTVGGDFISSGITTLASSGGITTTGGNLYVGGDLSVKDNLKVDGTSEFIGNVVFRGGAIGIGDSASDNIDVEGEFVSDLIPNTDAQYSLGITTQRWKDGLFSGLVTTNNLFSSGITTLASNGGITTTGGNLYVGGDLYIADDLRFDEFDARVGRISQNLIVGNDIYLGNDLYVTGDVVVYNTFTAREATISENLSVVGVSTFQNNVNVTGFVTVTEGIYYDLGDYDGPNGMAYFDNTGKLVGSASTENAVDTSYFILTTDVVGIPTWTSVIDGGEF